MTSRSNPSFATPRFFIATLVLSLGGCVSSEDAILNEELGSGERSSATLEFGGDGLEKTSVTFADGASSGDVAQFVKCSYGADPNVTGGLRLRVTAGYAGHDPTAEFTLRSDLSSYLGGSYSSGDGIEFEILAKTEGGDVVYSFLDVDGSSQECSVTLDEYSTYQVAGVVACSHLGSATATTPETISATLAFDCQLEASEDEGTPNNPSNQAGCSEGETKDCGGGDSCEGQSECSGGAWTECDCSETPRLILKQLPPSGEFEGVVEQTSGAGLSALAASLGDDGYIVLSGTANAVPYTLFGVRSKGSTQKYETVVEQGYGSNLADIAESMGASGYVPTVGMANQVPYTIIGVKPKGSAKVYETLTTQTTGSGLEGALSTMGDSGFIPLIAMANDVPYTIIGVREKGSAKKYATTMTQTIADGLETAMTSMTSQGYVVTAAMANSVPYTVIGVKDATETWSLGQRIDQTIGAGLSSMHTSFCSAGFIPLATTTLPAAYTFFGTSIAN